MIVDTEDLAQMLWNASLTAKPVPLAKVMPFVSTATPGHPTIDYPEKYRWFLIKKFPVSSFELSLQDILDEVGDQSTDDRYRHDKIAGILERGGEEWPALATATGILLDGYHRIAAHDTLKRKSIPVLVAVQKRGGDPWDQMWNEAFSR